jgi:hypothetical protein
MKHSIAKFKNYQAAASLKHDRTPKQAFERVQQQKDNDSYVLGKFLSSEKPLPIKPPPSNTSSKTIQDAKKVLKTMQTASQEMVKFSKKIDPNKPHYEMWAEKAEQLTGENYNEEWFRKIVRQTDSFMDYTKLLYKRSRPFDLGPMLGIDIKRIVVDPLSSAYPSAHSFEGWLFAYILSQKHPEHTKQFLKLAEMVALSRVIVGVHFYDDIEAGKKLAKFVFENSWVEIPK